MGHPCPDLASIRGGLAHPHVLYSNPCAFLSSKFIFLNRELFDLNYIIFVSGEITRTEMMRMIYQ